MFRSLEKHLRMFLRSNLPITSGSVTRLLSPLKRTIHPTKPPLLDSVSYFGVSIKGREARFEDVGPRPHTGGKKSLDE